MKRKRSIGRRKPTKKANGAGADNGNENFMASNAGDQSAWSDAASDPMDTRTKVDNTQANATTSRGHTEALKNDKSIEKTSHGNSLHGNSLFKDVVVSLAAKISRAVGSSTAEPRIDAMPVQDEMTNAGEQTSSRQVPLDNKKELNAALSVIKTVMKMEAAKPFNSPVDPVVLGIPDYYDIIDTPMDFDTICNNIDLGFKYRSSKDIYRDVELIWDNCSKYNKEGTEIIELMKQVKTKFLKLWSAAGLYVQRQEPCNVLSGKSLPHGAEDSVRHCYRGYTYPGVSMISNSIHQGNPSLMGQEFHQPYPSCCSYEYRPPQISSKCSCSWCFRGSQPFMYHNSWHGSPGPSLENHYNQRQFETSSQHDHSHNPHYHERWWQHQPSFDQHQATLHKPRMYSQNPGSSIAYSNQQKQRQMYSSHIDGYQPGLTHADDLQHHSNIPQFPCHESGHSHLDHPMEDITRHTNHAHEGLSAVDPDCPSFQKHRQLVVTQVYSRSRKHSPARHEENSGSAGHPHLNSPMETVPGHTKHVQEDLTAVDLDGPSLQNHRRPVATQVNSSSRKHPLARHEENSGSTGHFNVTPAGESSVRHVTPAGESSIRRITPVRESSVKYATPAGESSVRRVKPARESSVRRVTPAGESAVRHVTPAGESSVRHVTPAGESSVRHVTAAGESSVRHVTPAGESSVRHVTPAGESSVRRVTPAGESSVRHVTPVEESSVRRATPAGKSSVRHTTCQPESSVRCVTPAGESFVKHSTPARESSVKRVTPAEESSIRLVTPAGESSVKHVTPAVESSVRRATPARESSVRCATPAGESSVRHTACQPESSVALDTNNCSSEEHQMNPNEPVSPLSDYCAISVPDEDGHLSQPGSSTPEASPMGNEHIRDSLALTKKKTRVRGPTRYHKIDFEGERMSITTDELGQPVGVDAPMFIRFLGTIARDGHKAPLNYTDWRAMPEVHKENMWKEVQEKFIIDPNSKCWIMRSISTKWKNWKARLKIERYLSCATNEERLANLDDRVLPDQWEYLVSHWNSEKAERRSAINKATNAKVVLRHAIGSKSFAQLREEQREKRPDKTPPSRAELFIMTRKRKDGKPINEATSAIIEKLQQNQDTSQTSTVQDEVFSQIVGRRKNGQVRCVELGSSPCDIVPRKHSEGVANQLVLEAKAEVLEMKNKMVTMEDTCAQMAAQMATMMSMMSSLQKNVSNGNVPGSAQTTAGIGGGLPLLQISSIPSRIRSCRKKRL